MNNNLVYESSKELYHYGVKGMKWGVRRAAKRDANVRNARKQYKNAEKEEAKARDRYSGTIIGKNRRKAAYDNLEKASEKTRTAKKAYDDVYKKTAKSISDGTYTKPKKVKMTTNQKVGEVASKTVETMAMASLMDDIFYGGAGKKTIKATGRLAVEAYMKARGRTVIGWVD